MADINIKNVQIGVTDSNRTNIGVIHDNKKIPSDNTHKDDEVIPSLVTQVYENKTITVIILILVLIILLVFKFG